MGKGILVTGAAGYVGSATVRALLDMPSPHEDGHIVALDSLEPGLGFRENVPVSERVTFVHYRFEDKQTVIELVKRHEIDTVVHCAALIDVAESMRDPLRYHRVNHHDVGKLFDTVRHAKVRHIVFASSAAVYGTPEELPISECAPLRPESPYGVSKMRVEQLLRGYGGYEFTFAILRYFNIAGADTNARYGTMHGNRKKNPQHLVARSAQAALGIIPGLSLYGTDYPTKDGTCVRDYVHVLDVAAANCMALWHLREGKKSFTANVASGIGSSNLEVIETAKRISGIDFPVEHAARRDGDPIESVADITVGRRRLALGNMRSLENIVRDELVWQARLHGIDFQLPVAA